jgi:short-subunit dehydrogenase
MDLNGRTVLLTGATGGLGRAIAKSLAERGAKLVLSSRKGAELEELAASLPADGHRTIVADLANEGESDRLLEAAGDVDVLVANAALPGTGRIESFSEEEVARAIRVNLEVPMQMARALVPAMSKRDEGHLVFISSLSGKVPSPRGSVYNATKFGLRGFAHALRGDLASRGIGVSLVLPGFIRDAGMFAESGTKAPPGLGTCSPEEVGEGVAKAIEGNRAEVTVATIQQKLLSGFALRYPAIAMRVQRGSGERTADKLAAGQSDKR